VIAWIIGWDRFVLWIIVGLANYTLYGCRHGKLRQP
jgi:hypothetical protein